LLLNLLHPFKNITSRELVSIAVTVQPGFTQVFNILPAIAPCDGGTNR
jgi:hypothetical protein